MADAGETAVIQVDVRGERPYFYLSGPSGQRPLTLAETRTGVGDALKSALGPDTALADALLTALTGRLALASLNEQDCVDVLHFLSQWSPDALRRAARSGRLPEGYLELHIHLRLRGDLGRTQCQRLVTRLRRWLADNGTRVSGLRPAGVLVAVAPDEPGGSLPGSDQALQFFRTIR